MSEFAVPVVRVDAVENHPNADRLTIVTIAGFALIANKKEDGSWRYAAGDHVCYIPEGAVVPEWLLKRLGMWDSEKEKGILAGTAGNRVKAIKLRGIVSQGVMYPVDAQQVVGGDVIVEELSVSHPEKDPMPVQVGTDVAEYLGIIKYEPVIPVHMAGEIYAMPYAAKFDVESIQKYPDMFTPGEPVSVTEKAHGTCFQAGYLQNVCMPGNGFGSDQNIYVTSKGQGNVGLALKNNEQNAHNVYVMALKEMLDAGLEAKLAALSAMFGNQHIRLFGELIGPGVQDLSYGLKKKEVRLFDIAVGDAFLPPAAMMQAAEALNLLTVPVLYEGPYDLAVLIRHRDGKDTISNTHVREGIAIRAADPGNGRKIGKWVSPDYLLRKNGTEYN